MVLGQSACGKSSLVRSLQHGRAQPAAAYDRTAGWERTELVLPIRANSSVTKQARISVLDCSGEAVYASLQTAAAVPGALVLLTFDISDDRWDDVEPKAGKAWMLLRDAVLTWLQTLQCCHKHCPVLLVGTKRDKVFTNATLERRRRFVWRNVKQLCGEEMASNAGMEFDIPDRLTEVPDSMLHELQGIQVLGCHLASSKSYKGIPEVHAALGEAFAGDTVLPQFGELLECTLMEARILQHNLQGGEPYMDWAFFVEEYKAACEGMEDIPGGAMSAEAVARWLHKHLAVTRLAGNGLEPAGVFVAPELALPALISVVRHCPASGTADEHRAHVARFSAPLATKSADCRMFFLSAAIAAAASKSFVEGCQTDLSSLLERRLVCDSCYLSFCSQHIGAKANAILPETGTQVKWRVCGSCTGLLAEAWWRALATAGPMLQSSLATADPGEAQGIALTELQSQGMLTPWLVDLLWRRLRLDHDQQQELYAALKDSRVLLPSWKSELMMVPWMLPARRPEALQALQPESLPSGSVQMGCMLLYPFTPVDLVARILAAMWQLANTRRIPLPERYFWGNGAALAAPEGLVLVDAAWELLWALHDIVDAVGQSYTRLPKAATWGFCPFCSNEFEHREVETSATTAAKSAHSISAESAISTKSEDEPTSLSEAAVSITVDEQAHIAVSITVDERRTLPSEAASSSTAAEAVPVALAEDALVDSAEAARCVTTEFKPIDRAKTSGSIITKDKTSSPLE
eukprot:gene19703-23569_t